MEQLNERLLHALQSAKITKQALSRAVGISPTAIGKWFTGATSSIENEHLIKAALCLNVKAEWLGAGVGEIERDATPKLEVTELLDQLFDKVAQTPDNERAKIGANLNFLAQSKTKEEASIYIKMLVDILNIYTLRVYTQQEYENLKSKTATEETAKMKQELKMGDMSMVQEQNI